MNLPSWLDWLEERMGFIAVPHLIRAIVLLNIATFLLEAASPGFTRMLILDADALRAGEWWRLVSFIFVPAAGGPTFWGILFLFFFLYLTWIFGDALEEAWGSFKTTLFILIPVLLTGLVAFLLYRGPLPNDYVLRPLLLAFAALNPQFTLMIFPIPVPIRIVWIAWLLVALLLLQAIASPMLVPLMLAGFSSYLLYIVPGWLEERMRSAAAKRRREKFLRGNEDDKPDE